MAARWWDGAVVYQVYLRSFADSNGDGVGDLRGLRSRLHYLEDLGVDAIWLNPCFASPQRDHGYDIADYFAIDPAYGTVEDLSALVGEAHGRGLRVLMDLVANHSSDQHEWFADALADVPGGRARDRYIFRDGRGANGDCPPNNWESVFGGPAWTRVVEPNGSLGQWYLHAFDSSQPDFNWRNDDVVEHFERVLRFWLGLGVDGFRIDVAHGMFKAEGLPDVEESRDGRPVHNLAMWDQPEVHDVYRSWRQIADGYAPDGKYLIGEVWVPGAEQLGAYLSTDELHQTFNFDLLVQPWNAGRVRAAVERGLAQARVTGAAPAWVLNNHDVHRAVTRYGQCQDLREPDPTDMLAAARRRGPVDADIGVARARAMAMVLMALPGTAYLYQGEELGLPEALDLDDGSRQDPIWRRSKGAEIGRDGCRIPLPWTSTGSSWGFSPEGSAAEPWLPQPPWFADFTAEDQAADPTSTLSVYRDLLDRRRELFVVDNLTWLDWGPDVLAFARGNAQCLVNFGPEPVRLHEDTVVRATSSPGAEYSHELAGNQAVWLEVSNTTAPPESRPLAAQRA